MKSFSLTGEAFCLPEYQTSTPIIIWKQTLENMSKIYGARKAEDAAQLTKAIDTEMNRYGMRTFFPERFALKKQKIIVIRRFCCDNKACR